jgi:hypothetical protein
MGVFDLLFRRKRLFSLKPTDKKMWEKSRASGIAPKCNCRLNPQGAFTELNFHSETQDTECEGWKILLELIEKAASKRSQEFTPGLDMSPELWSQVITLPASISTLTSVKKLYLYSSHLVRLPPEIGEMADLEELDVYTSYRLHWLPYEVTRCPRLKKSRANTRALYGNYKRRPPFPKLERGQLPAVVRSQTCSVCRALLKPESTVPVWISLRVATDVFPLLVNACSDECVRRLPRPPKAYVEWPHTGGLNVIQPPTYSELFRSGRISDLYSKPKETQ